MLVFFEARLAIFAMPKTGSTAYHMALRPRAEIALVNRTKVKHMTVRKYHTYMEPFLKGAYGLQPERVAVMRDPVDQARSWYTYRQRPKTQGTPNSTVGISFDEFITEMISANPPKRSHTGSPARFLSLPDGGLGVEHLFAYERLERFHQFLEDRIGIEFKTKEMNVSPNLPSPLDPAVEAQFRTARPDDFALYDRLMAADGYLLTDIGAKTG